MVKGMACIFKDYLTTCKGDSDVNLIEISQLRYQSVRNASQNRGDTLEKILNLDLHTKTVCLHTHQQLT